MHYMYVESERSTPVRATIFQEGRVVARWDLERGLAVSYLNDEIARRDAVLDWLRENAPTGLELCPIKIDG